MSVSLFTRAIPTIAYRSINVCSPSPVSPIFKRAAQSSENIQQELTQLKNRIHVLEKKIGLLDSVNDTLTAKDQGISIGAMILFLIAVPIIGVGIKQYLISKQIDRERKNQNFQDTDFESGGGE